MYSPTISPSFNIYALININYIITIRQLHTISHNPSKGKNTSYYDKHCVHKRFARYSLLKTIFDKVRLSCHKFKTIVAIQLKLSKKALMPQLCIHFDHI